MLYSQWRSFRKSPFESLYGRPPRRGELDPAREEILLEAFAIYSAERERDLRDTMEGLAKGLSKGK